MVLSLYISICICLWVECFSSVSPFLSVSCWDAMHINDKLCIHWTMSVSVPDKQKTDMGNHSTDLLLLLAVGEQEWIVKEDVYKCRRLQRSHYRLSDSHCTVCTAFLTWYYRYFLNELCGLYNMSKTIFMFCFRLLSQNSWKMIYLLFGKP